MGAFHDSLINQVLLEWPGSKRSGFAREMLALLDRLEADRFIYPFYPDAFLVDESERRIILFEAVVTSDITDSKFESICGFALYWDDLDWDTILIRVDRYGSVAWQVFNTIVRGAHAGRLRGILPLDWRDAPKTDPRNPEPAGDILMGVAPLNPSSSRACRNEVAA